MRSGDPGKNVRLMTDADREALGRRALDMVGKEPALVLVGNRIQAENNFARGDAHLMQQGSDIFVQIIVKGCTVGTSRTDDAGLRSAIAAARTAATEWNTSTKETGETPPREFGKRNKASFESTEAALDPAKRAELFRRALDATEAAGLIGAGDVKFSMKGAVVMSSGGMVVHLHKSYGEVSLTARTKDGKGSGWAWSGYEDFDRVTPDVVIARAIDLAQRSANPVAVEPGRYTVILEPAALASLIDGINWSAYWADQGTTVFSKNPRGTNKIGLQMIDRRLGMVADPWDSEKPDETVDEGGDMIEKVDWFKTGVLRDLYYDKTYAEMKGRQLNNPPSGLRLFGAGETSTLDEMIASTKRGIWVNRLHGAFAMVGRTMMMTGTTRDGTFLIENGKITKAIKNLRFTESPFFVLNKLDAFGEPVRASASVVAPRVKVRDFDFTSLTDAV